MSHVDLERACRNECLEDIEAILEPLNEQERRQLLDHTCGFDKWSVLHEACCCGRIAVAKLLIGKGADVEIKDKFGCTPLHLACDRKKWRTAEWLIALGADPKAKNNAGKTPLHNLRHSDLEAAVKRFNCFGGPRSYHLTSIAVSRLTSEAPKDELVAITSSLYHTKSTLSFAQRAELTTVVLDKLGDLLAYMRFDIFSQMLTRAAKVVQVTCAAGRGKSPLERPSRSDMEHFDSMLASIQEELERAHQQLQQQQQQTMQTFEEAKQGLRDYQIDLEEVLAKSYDCPVSAMDIEQAHAFVCAVGAAPTLKLETFQEQGLDGELLTQLSMTDVEQMTGLKPLGLCHRVVHCAKMAAEIPRPELMKTDFAAGVAQLDEWLEQRNDATGNKYREMLKETKVDIWTCDSLCIGDMKDMNVPPVDRKKLVELLHKASLSVAQPATPSHPVRKRMSPEEQQQVLEQVLQENQALAVRLKEQQAGQQRAVPDELMCPITMDLMQDPVLAEDGIVYDREAIVTWQRQTGRSPMTRQALGNEFKPVLAMKNMVNRFAEQSEQ
eukprot:TRINITY_DN12551_c0_g7_i1.p1 TRINITY_DN12551_c0_g7~~TRINITY_DN12551_c0_g7_i1.p1  ORF type:complete len:553 (+),score=143.71 TRINITY_DN12551_c0_g7_i1:144-1802(+)